ncbi:HER125Cp [Eremothecium sinecaudum]|uniref:HER125Cp n=1 Tax=Eremothecium sinecaudum TaxID=45286 RepID=A0A0X8HTW7_9SACH|nr:HER125Cp [Eremothecium sinecaudum]AMD21404.1 HER125Cp [Eremothecium sinecaudum]
MMPYLTPPLSNSSLGTTLEMVSSAGLQMLHQPQLQQQQQQQQQQQGSQQHQTQYAQAQKQPYFPLAGDGAQQPTPPLMPLPTAGVNASSAMGDTGIYRYHKQISKSFQDDLIYCPRTLLNKEELNQCYQMDMLMMMEMQQQLQQLPQHVQQLSHPQQQQQQLLAGSATSGAAPQGLQSIKFNPYTSQSFNPSGATSPSS